MVSILFRKKSTESKPNRIGVACRVLYIWMADGDVVGIYQSSTKKERQRILAEDGYTACQWEIRSDIRVGVCKPDGQEGLSDDTTRLGEGHFQVWG
jgi:hypothetical protein